MDAQPIETAPRDGQVILVRTEAGVELVCRWTDGLLDSDENDCGGWAAEDDYPPSWTDGICWKANDAGVQSDPPVAWFPA